MDFGFWADIAGFLGFLVSTGILIFESIKSRMRFLLKVIDYNDSGPSTRFLISITNLSRSPLSIESVVFHGTTCELQPKKIRGNPEAWNGVTTNRFPVRVPPRDIEFVYLEFLTPQYVVLTQGMTVTFQIQTIRKQVSKTLLLGSRLHYLNKRE